MRKPRTTPHYERNAMVNFMLDQTGWVTQTEITNYTGLSGVQVRRVCQVYQDQFISSTEGYKLTVNASRREIQHCVATLISRANKMLNRARNLDYKLVA